MSSDSHFARLTPCPEATFLRTDDPSGIVTSSILRESVYLRHVFSRTPRVDVLANIAETTFALSSSMHITHARMPGLPFFITACMNETSFAPAAKMRSDAKASSSPVMSSTLKSSSQIVPSAAGCASFSPSVARTTFARGKSLRPAPNPTASDFMSGCGPNDVANVFSSAAPVGVQSSPAISPSEYDGTP